MGKYFVMSYMFNKTTASDFGFLPNGENEAIDPADNSIWIKTLLYDFGWGQENGFYKTPLPGFDVLMDLVLYSKNRSDIYGAAEIILEKYPYELLAEIEKIMTDQSRKAEFERMAEIFDLQRPTNRCPVIHKAYEQMMLDFSRWEKVSEAAKRIKPKRFKRKRNDKIWETL